MFKAYAQKLGPPFSGQVQIVESDTYRAMTLDGDMWEIQYVNRIHVRAATVSAAEIKSGSYKKELISEGTADPKLVALMEFLNDVELPFESHDHYEYWLLDREEQSPMAMMFSCSQESQMKKFPVHADWTALPDSVMPVVKTQKEIDAKMAPVNYRVESAVSERAGTSPKARWYDRREHDDSLFPPLLVREDWPDADQQALCSRYLERQAPRLLMLRGLSDVKRDQLEMGCKPYASEVARFCVLYPKVLHEEHVNALRVEARIRAATGGEKPISVIGRRDGVLYI